MAEKTVEKSTENKDKKKLNLGVIIGCAVAAVLVIVAIIVFAVIKPFNKDLTGKYDLTSMEVNGEDQASTVALMKAFGVSATLEVENSKEGKINIFGDEAKFTYDGSMFHFEKKDDGEDDDSLAGVDAKYETKDDTITIIHEEEKDGEKNVEKLIFTKTND
jgi:hypothetical protein